MLSYLVNGALEQYFNQYSLSLEALWMVNFLVQPVIFMIFFLTCYRYSYHRWERWTVWLSFVAWCFVSIFGIIYTYPFTELIIKYGDTIKEEITVNLFVTFFIEGRDDEWWEIRLWIITVMFMWLKLVTFS